MKPDVKGKTGDLKRATANFYLKKLSNLGVMKNVMKLTYSFCLCQVPVSSALDMAWWLWDYILRIKYL